jgi:TolB protein
VLAAAAATLLAAALAPPLAKGQAPAGEIAFVSDVSGDSEIYLVPAAGGSPLNLTNHPAQDAAPAWSRDGERLAFASTRRGTWDLYVLTIADGTVRQVTDDPGAEFDPSWSPRARLVHEATVRGRRSIRVVAPDGRQSAQVAEPARRRFDLDPQWWSRTTPRIVFGSDRRGSFDLWVTTVGGTPRALTHGPADDFRPTLASDGKTVAFERARGDNYDLYTVRGTNGPVRRLTDGTPDDWEPSWEPRDAHIAFASNRDGNSDIYVLETATGGITNVTRTAYALETTPAWRPASMLRGFAGAWLLHASADVACPASGRLVPTPGGTRFPGAGNGETICGGGGDDRIWGNGGDDSVYGDAGRDKVWGGPGHDRLYGGSEGDGPDRLYGQDGDDMVWAKGDGARDCVWGGPGNDLARLSLGDDRWSDNRSPAPSGGGRCGRLRRVEALG